jgi:hypothetical protein
VTEGVDYAFSQPSPAGLFAAGKRFAMRYIGPGTDDKHLHASERDALWAAGLEVVLLAEGAASSALGGFSTGQSHASLALSDARTLGAPESLPFYFAVDFDVTASQWPTVAQYFSGAASVIGASRVGIYGGIRAMQWAARDGVAAWFFQTFAWSAGQWYPGNHVEQYQNDVQLAGGTVDLCRAVTNNFGQWTSGGGDMPITENDWQTLIWRIDALISNRPVVAGGPTVGEPNELHNALAAIKPAAFVHCPENGGYYAYGMGEPKWYLSTDTFNAARAAFGNPATVEVATLDQVRNAFGYIPGTADMVAAGAADVIADAHGNVIPAAGGGGSGPSSAEIAKAVNDEASRRLAG